MGFGGKSVDGCVPRMALHCTINHDVLPRCTQTFPCPAMLDTDKSQAFYARKNCIVSNHNQHIQCQIMC